MRISLFTFVGFLAALPGLNLHAAERATGFAKWEPEIAAFETSDRESAPPSGAVLFIGSSSIRKWTSLKEDFPEHRVIGRGFGGSQIVDSTHFADRIIFPYRPSLIVLYAGDNDLAAGKSPRRVLLDFEAFVKTVHERLPRTGIAFIAIKPSLARLKLAPQIRSANELIRAYCAVRNQLHYIDIYHPMLTADGKPRPELFVSDGLHMNGTGYELWTEVIEPYLPR